MSYMSSTMSCNNVSMHFSLITNRQIQKVKCLKKETVQNIKYEECLYQSQVIAKIPFFTYMYLRHNIVLTVITCIFLFDLNCVGFLYYRTLN